MSTSKVIKSVAFDPEILSSFTTLAASKTKGNFSKLIGIACQQYIKRMAAAKRTSKGSTKL